MKDFLDKYPKFKNPYFYLSVIGLIFSASGIDFNILKYSVLRLRNQSCGRFFFAFVFFFLS